MVFVSVPKVPPSRSLPLSLDGLACHADFQYAKAIFLRREAGKPLAPVSGPSEDRKIWLWQVSSGGFVLAY